MDLRDEASYPELPWFSREELARFSEFLTGDAETDQRNVRALLATVTEVLGERSLDRLLRRLLDQVISTARAERGALFLLDKGRLAVKVARDAEGHDLADPLQLSQTLPRNVFRTGRPVLARVTGEGEVLSLTTSVAAMRLRQVMCAPLRAGGRTLGVVYIDSTLRGAQLSPSALTLLSTQAGLLGMAIEHHRLFSEAADAQAVRAQLQVARDIQHGLLPRGTLVHAGVEFAGHSEPFARVGGDYFDYLPLDENRVGFAVGDVSGHGIGPALVMSNVRAHVRSLLQTRRTLDGLYGRLNVALCDELVGGMFVSLFVGVFHKKEMVLEYQNAGQTAPLLYRAGEDRFVEVESNAPALGVIADRSAGPCPRIPVRPGDSLVCYTDGVTESRNAEGGFFGAAGLLAAVHPAVRRGATAAEVVAAVREHLAAHLGEKPQHDDVTLLAARFLAR